ncbi:DUF445 family protein [Selenihalanaerobacter shriftii]|uniref:Uncharacterized membrane protein YheB, UPF0754 family n=1 Tax=Selenihalanaerobacter shriftii TaxID=142842 RepID=A0A1T4K646_9FIRM|nr:DUF445 family protein [Selenihalanaerobacter shriftii]SJZ37803.1 Uncharacterized membrane protein YheB, UPF0754 family [Selenihalanaerobacter shriftii]
MNIVFIVSPIIGSIIGYFTNWVAIKMLFRPLKEKRFLGIKLPFTPGVIPRRRGKLAESIGDTVGKRLLTPDAFQNMLESEEMKSKIRDFIKENIKNLADEERSTQEILDEIITDNEKRNKLEMELKNFISNGIQNLLSNEEIVEMIKSKLDNIDPKKVENYLESDEYQELKSKIEEALITNLHKDSTKQRLVEFIEEKLEIIKDNKQSIGEVLPAGIEKSLKGWLAEQGPHIVERLVEFLDSEATKDRINQKLEEILSNNPLMQMASGFIDKDKIINQFIDHMIQFLEEEENQKELVAQVESILDSILETELSSIIERFDEASLDELSEFLLTKLASKDLIDRLLSSLEDSLLKKVNNAQSLDSEDKINISEIVGELVERLMKSEFLYNTLESWAYNQLDSLSKRPVANYFEGLETDTIEKLEVGILAGLEYIVENHLGRVLATLDFEEMVIRKVNTFDILEVEGLLLNVIETELKAITWFGAVLGLILGLITPIISLIMS